MWCPVLIIFEKIYLHIDYLNGFNMHRSVLFRFTLIFICANVWSQIPAPHVALNQIGFYSDASKTSVVVGAKNSGSFFVMTTNHRDTVFRGVLGDSIRSVHSSVVTRIADFSGLKTEGSFVVVVPSLGEFGRSPVFQIGNAIFSNVSASTLKAFYYQRVSMPLDEKYAGRWHRSAGHPDKQVLIHPSAASQGRPSGFVLSSPRGWYDAGDYNKYVVNSGITMGTLMSAYEDFPEYFNKLGVHIPESGNGIPDILDEVLYNLRWMLTMQDPADGGVYHKLTNANFDGMVMPGITTEPRFLVQKSTAAALDFTAVMAQASRIFKTFSKELPGLSDSCRNAALKSWQWSINHPGVVYDQDKMNTLFQPAVQTGAYGDGNFDDERFWASAELFRSMGDPQYLKMLAQVTKINFAVPSWDHVAMLGVYSLLRGQSEAPKGFGEQWTWMKKMVVGLADGLVNYSVRSAFKVSMGSNKSDFVWGSNSNAANQGILLLNAFRYSGDRKYLNVALSNADYLMGRNALGICFVTGYGSKSPMHPHHRPSVADGIIEPVPGFLVGGPNPYRQDNCLYAFKETETAYTDADCSYASNEIAINWNAPAVYLFGALESVLR